jgi:hypothetical protein
MRLPFYLPRKMERERVTTDRVVSKEGNILFRFMKGSIGEYITVTFGKQDRLVSGKIINIDDEWLRLESSPGIECFIRRDSIIMIDYDKRNR